MASHSLHSRPVRNFRSSARPDQVISIAGGYSSSKTHEVAGDAGRDGP